MTPCLSFLWRNVVSKYLFRSLRKCSVREDKLPIFLIGCPGHRPRNFSRWPQALLTSRHIRRIIRRHWSNTLEVGVIVRRFHYSVHANMLNGRLSMQMEMIMVVARAISPPREIGAIPGRTGLLSR